MEDHLKGVLYWGGYNLVNFPSLVTIVVCCLVRKIGYDNYHFSIATILYYLLPTTPAFHAVNAAQTTVAVLVVVLCIYHPGFLLMSILLC